MLLSLNECKLWSQNDSLCITFEHCPQEEKQWNLIFLFRSKLTFYKIFLIRFASNFSGQIVSSGHISNQWERDKNDCFRRNETYSLWLEIRSELLISGSWKREYTNKHNQNPDGKAKLDKSICSKIVRTLFLNICFLLHAIHTCPATYTCVAVATGSKYISCLLLFQEGPWWNNFLFSFHRNIESNIFQDEFICFICKNYFIDPVTTGCGHSFCMPCLCIFWEEALRPPHCPVCWTTSPQTNLKTNIVLRTRTFLARRARPHGLPGFAEKICLVHMRRKGCFCEVIKDLVCVLCSKSKEHAAHRHCSVDWLAEEYRVSNVYERSLNLGNRLSERLWERKWRYLLSIHVPYKAEAN